MADLTELPYARWLEKTLGLLIKGEPVEAICMLTKTSTGEVAMDYHECTMEDFMLFSGLLQQEALIETLKIRGLVPEEENDEQEEVS